MDVRKHAVDPIPGVPTIDTRVAAWRGAVKAAVERKTVAVTSASASVWMTIKEAAAYLGVGVDIIYDACSGGGLRHAKFGHRTIRLRREWVDRWAESRAREFA
jgi:excisionase family DNA binding protein